MIFFCDRGDKVIAVASMNMDPIVAQAAEVMLCGKSISKQEVAGFVIYIQQKILSNKSQIVTIWILFYSLMVHL